jgi:cation transport ATPase
MATDPQAAPKLRWWRALVAALVAEFALICVAIPIYSAAANPAPILNMAIPPASALLFLPAGYWSALPIPQRGIWQGVLTGVWAVGLYLVLGLIASLFVKGASVTDGFTTAYLTAHALKIVGAAIGGWLVSRKVSVA